MELDHTTPLPPSDRDDPSTAESEPEPPVDLMVVSRARRSNAGNRMSTLLAKTAQEEEEWGEEWEDAPNEEEFVGDDANDQDDYNMDSSSSEEEDDGADDDAGEKELQKAERQERIKKRKSAPNPFAARLAATRKKVKLDVPSTSTQSPAPRPKKKSERASWIPTEEDGPTRTSSRRQTIANKEHTLAKLKAKDRRRDDTLAMMKAAEARKAKDEPKAMSQAERLIEAARVERVNRKTLHRWEEAEEARAAERQAKLDALKNRQIEGPFIRYYSGPGIFVDDKIKYTGKDAPNPEELEEKLNKDVPTSEPQGTPTGPVEHQSVDPASDQTQKQPNPGTADQSQTSMGLSQTPLSTTWTSQQQQQPSFGQPTQSSQAPPQQPSQQQSPFTAASQASEKDPFMGSHGMHHSTSITFVSPQNPDSFVGGIDQNGQGQQVATQQAEDVTVVNEQPTAQVSPAPQAPVQPADQPATDMKAPKSQPIDAQVLDHKTPKQEPAHQLGPDQQAPKQEPQTAPSDPQQDQSASNLVARPQASPTQPEPSTAQPQPPLPHPQLPLNNPNLPPPNDPATQLQTPQAPPPPPRRKVVRRALRNLLILSSFSNLDAPTSTRSRSAASLLKEKDRSVLIQLSTTLFNWSHADATAFVNAMLNAPKRITKASEAALKPKKELCAVTNAVARYRDPETGIAYRDSRAFGVLRGVVGGGFVWSGDLGCYVGGRAKPVDGPNAVQSKGFLGMKPATGVPRRFLEMAKVGQEASREKSQADKEGSAGGQGNANAPATTAAEGAQQNDSSVVKTEEVNAS